MMRNELAEMLILAKTEQERKSLLKASPRIADLDLAIALKEVCYASWTSEPTKAQASAKALKSLEKFSPSEEITAFGSWISGIAFITTGKLEFAVENLNRSAAIFLRLGKEHESAQTQVSKLYALALLGRYDEAIETGRNAIQIFEKFDDQIAAGKVEKNIGNMFWRRDLYLEAKEYFFSAQERFVKLHQPEELAMVENCLATVCTSQNSFLEAEKFYALALKSAKESKMLVTNAEIEASMGNFFLFRGKYVEALQTLESSRQKFFALEMPTQTAIADLEIADAYLELNLAQEAFEIYTKIAPEFAKHKMQAEEARSRAQLARSAILLRENKIVRRELRKSAKLYQNENNFVGLAGVKLNVAQFELAEKNFSKAFEVANEAKVLLQNLGNKRHLLLTKFLQGESLRNLGKLNEAEKILAETLKESFARERTNLAQLCHVSLGKLAVQNGKLSDAENHFKDAILLIENLRDPLPSEEFRMAFLSDKLVAFEELARIYLSAEMRLPEAFEMIEKSRARTLSETSLVSKGSSQNKQTLAKLQLKLATLREELNWFYSRLSRAKDKKEFTEIQSETEKRETEIANTSRQISAFEASSPIQKQGFNLAKLQKQLGDERVLLEFVCFNGEFSAFVVTNQSIEFVKKLGTETEILESLTQIRFQFGALRYGAENLKAFLPELTKRAKHYLETLYKKLLFPLEEFIEDKNLVIVPTKSLHYVPFHTLFNGEKYLIETREVSYAPSSTVLQIALAKKQNEKKNPLLIGFADEKVPLVNEEIKAIARILPNAKSLTMENATFANFKSLAPQTDILHVACHGQFRAENPLFSSLHLADGFVTVRDVCALELHCDLVTLSACETGLNEISAGEEILGLARGFISAGASSLVLSLWTVNDAATTRLMKSFYAALQNGNSLAKSLQIAQRQQIAENLHPYFWSPFILIGKF